MPKKYFLTFGLIALALFSSHAYGTRAQTNRDIFSPPPGRQGRPSAVPGLPTVAGFDIPTSTASTTSSTINTTTIVNSVTWKSEPDLTTYQAVNNNSDKRLDNFITWLPYVFILIGAVGFAWGVRGQRRLSNKARPLATSSSQTSVKPLFITEDSEWSKKRNRFLLPSDAGIKGYNTPPPGTLPFNPPAGGLGSRALPGGLIPFIKAPVKHRTFFSKKAVVKKPFDVIPPVKPAIKPKNNLQTKPNITKHVVIPAKINKPLTTVKKPNKPTNKVKGIIK